MDQDVGSTSPNAGGQSSEASSRFGEVYFAFKPEPSAAMEADRVSRKSREAFGLTSKPLACDRLHMTLLYLGDIPDLQQAFLDRACDVAAGVAWPPVDVTFDRVRTFPVARARKPFVLIARDGNASLSLFQRELVKTMKNSGLILRKLSSFRPHVTLARDSMVIPETPLDPPITWTMTEFQLVFSDFGKGHHECLGRWPLRGW